MGGLVQPRGALALAALASATALAAAFIGQYGLELQPCVLCVYQRWPYVITIAALFGLFAFTLFVVPAFTVSAFNSTTVNLAVCSLAVIALAELRVMESRG